MSSVRKVSSFHLGEDKVYSDFWNWFLSIYPAKFTGQYIISGQNSFLPNPYRLTIFDQIPIWVGAMHIITRKLIQHHWLSGMEYILQFTGWLCGAAHARRTQNPTTVSCRLWCGVKCVALTTSRTAVCGNLCVWPNASASVSSRPFATQSLENVFVYFKNLNTS